MNKRYRFKEYSVWIEKHSYANGRTALLLMDDDGQIACATVNLPDQEIKPNEVCVKDWSENEGMLQFLVSNGIVEYTGRDIPTGWVQSQVCRLLI